MSLGYSFDHSYTVRWIDPTHTWIWVLAGFIATVQPTMSASGMWVFGLCSGL